MRKMDGGEREPKRQQGREGGRRGEEGGAEGSETESLCLPTAGSWFIAFYPVRYPTQCFEYQK